MKHAIQNRLFLKIGGLIIAVRFGLAAQRDEQNGFPLTAAMEWRKAAELSDPIAPLTDRCWREWERIMRLPRRQAGPIGVAPVVQLAPAERCSPMAADLGIEPTVASAA
jgi:hypothetical protein